MMSDGQRLLNDELVSGGSQLGRIAGNLIKEVKEELEDQFYQNSDSDSDAGKESQIEELPKYDGPGYAVIHRGQRPTPKPMPEPAEHQRQPVALKKPPVPTSSKPPLLKQQRGDTERSVISNTGSAAPSNVSRASS